MVNCLVLGGNGFLGSHLVDDLVGKGFNVRAFDRFNNQKIRFESKKNVEIINGEFLNSSDLEEAVKDMDYVFHFVSTTNPLSSTFNPMVEIDTNIRSSVELFEKCVEAKVKKVIYSSSGGSVYVTKPISPYAIGKLTIEKYLNYFYHQYGMESISYRIANPYGPRQPLLSKQGVIPIFLNCLLNKEPIKVFGDGSMIRDYIFVKDAITMITNSFENGNYSLYNLGSGLGNSISEVIEAIEEVTRQKFEIEKTEAPKTFVHTNTLDTSRYVNEFPGLSLTSLKEGIAQTWANLKEASNEI